MGILRDYVTAGDYKGADIVFKGIINRKAHLITRGFFSKDIILNNKTVDRIECIDKSQLGLDFVGTQTVQAIIYFKNGKKAWYYSLLECINLSILPFSNHLLLQKRYSTL